MFTAHPQTFSQDLVITKPISHLFLVGESVNFYDKDGFELTPLEKRFYLESDIPLTECLYNLAVHKPWMHQNDYSTGVRMDHSMILERYSFGGAAREQLLKQAKDRICLYKLLQTKHKWGIDFSVDYIEDGEVTDVFHLEIDSYDYDHIMEVHYDATKRILDIDWVDAGRRIRRNRDQWQHLEGHAQSNWKANFFGFPASEEICKVL